MKRFLIIIIISCIVLNVPNTYCDVSYARILNNQTYLYKTANAENSIKNIICIMENTYYVEILLTYDEDFYKVNYNGVSGFVLRKEVKKVNQTPNNPYPKDVKMLTINNNIYLRSTPEKTNNNLSIIPSNCTKLNYIGKVYGEQLDDFRGNTWYFVEYEGVYGYVYSEYLKSVDQIAPNIEELSFINDSDFDDIINPLSNGTCAIIIASLLVPIMLILYLLYKKPSKRKERFKEKVVIVKEYDDRL